MKLFFVILMVVSIIHKIKADTTETCAWQDDRNKLVSKLTRNGQKTANKILLDIQYITGFKVLILFLKNTILN